MNNVSDDQKTFYQKVYDTTRQEIEDIQTQIEEELAKVKEKITKLNNQKQAIRKMYEGACACLGIESEFEEMDEGEEGFEEEEEE